MVTWAQTSASPRSAYRSADWPSNYCGSSLPHP